MYDTGTENVSIQRFIVLTDIKESSHVFLSSHKY